ncbi:MAG: hypothetical protein H0V18_04065 [Pyrinomonadaceae bacterium]|jgi:hypothetical protein|nr:hypothetical protein [Pyrinomonadaceae bacterium]
MSAVRAKALITTCLCPSSEDISRPSLPRSKSTKIAFHIVGCEFCAAEQSFLSAYSQTIKEYESPKMPAHLRRLSKVPRIGKLNASYKGLKYGKGSSRTMPGFAFALNLRARAVVG